MIDDKVDENRFYDYGEWMSNSLHGCGHRDYGEPIKQGLWERGQFVTVVEDLNNQDLS